jgi:hypothetical protein
MARDVDALKATARRVHFASFYVAACKFEDAPAEYTSLIRDQAATKIEKRITRKEAEDRVIERVKTKAERLQRGLNPEVRRLVAPELIADYYRDTIIPLTKRGEVLVLMNRKV